VIYVQKFEKFTIGQKQRFFQKMTPPTITSIFLILQIILYRKISTRRKSNHKKIFWAWYTHPRLYLD